MEPKAALQRALEELRRQKAEIASLRQGSREPVAIVGLGCRFPGAEGPDAFWDLLAHGGDAITDIPAERWPASRFYDADPSAAGKMATHAGGFIRDADRFDAAFFGIAPREAQMMDPQQRVLLETAWEALEHANIPPDSLYGSDTGVFVGITCFDHAIRLMRAPGGLTSHAGTGSALNMAPGRLSYVLGLTGPSMAIDTACSSSLVALHLACQSLRQRETSLALAGGVHLILSPQVMVSFSQARMLAGDGRSKTFAASADGYGRGEGCGVLVLKRLSDALTDGNRILGVVRGTAVNQDGPSGGLTVPSGLAQRRVITRALDSAGVSPAQVDYVEAHGTGTPLGDPIELEALASVYGQGREAGRPLVVGSVKTNIGHLEPAAGMAALIKVLLAFEHQTHPAHLHFTTPNPHIAWKTLPVRVPTAAEPWTRGNRPRLAGVSAFGFSGTNAHVVLEEPPVTPPPETVARPAPDLLVLSARTDAALRRLAARYAAWLATTQATVQEVCRAAAVGRAHLPCRLALVVRDAATAAADLRQIAEGACPDTVLTGRAATAGYGRDTADQLASREEVYARLADAARSAAVREDMLREVAAWFVAGTPVAWDRLCGTRRPAHVALPTYPFERERHWFPTPDDTPEAPEVPDEWWYQLAWEATPLTPGVATGRHARSAALIAGAADALAPVLQAKLAEAGVATETCGAEGGGRPRLAATTDVVFLARATEPDAAGAECVALMRLAQEALAQPGPTARLWVVTRGAATPGRDMTLVGAAQAAVAAFMRVVGLEHPELLGRVVDLDPSCDVAASAAQLVQELQADSADAWIAWRSAERLAPRVARVAPPVASVPVRADATYLVSGGLGHLGLQVASWLAARGARHLCLLGRHGITTPQQQAALDLLAQAGVQVQVATHDLADGAAVRRLVASLPADLPLRGVLHLAGIQGWTELARLAADEVVAVLRPKAAGAKALHEATLDQPLDFFVCFSSIASAWGSRGQAHYAAASAYLDGLAHARRAAGLPAVTIDWGPWSEGGMTSGEAAELLGRVGVRLLPPAVALAALDRAAAGALAQPVIADIDWSRFRASYEARGHSGLLSRLAPATPDARHAGDETALARAVRQAAPPVRRRLVTEAVQREVAQVLGLQAGMVPDLHQGLFEMGLDSLMAVDLREHLQTLSGCPLPATLAFDCPTIAELAALLLGRLAPATGTAPVSTTPITPSPGGDASLSDAEAEARLLAQLDALSTPRTDS